MLLELFDLPDGDILLELFEMRAADDIGRGGNKNSSLNLFLVEQISFILCCCCCCCCGMFSFIKDAQEFECLLIILLFLFLLLLLIEFDG